MTQLVDVTNMCRWIDHHGVEKIIAGILEYIEKDFVRWEEFDKIPRVASHTPIGVIELMPTSDSIEYGFKYVNGHPSNPARGFQTVTAFGFLADVDNGYPTFEAEMTLLTALRTAATSAMAAKYLARKDSEVMAMIGSGSQSEFQALGFRAALGIEKVRIFDIDPDAMEKFRRNIEPLGIEVYIADSVEDALEGADIITTCTADKAQNTILDYSLVRPGVHINGVGGDCPGKTELDPRILDDATVFVEFPPQTRIEGEIQNKGEDFEVVELWKVIAGKVPGRSSDEEITLFDSVGFAIEDFSALRYLRDSTAGTDFQTYIELVADPDDPKDLFSLTTKVLSPM
ncbi:MULTISPECIES: ornithine cyclodeaminase [Corynebacterium]|uniref:Ornithine cyclodeaminase n=1 Tax=Corynebacterium coyleae TaxID=53374 RepID=A0ABX8KVD2_9CORY|nr:MULTISPECIES: ornithine cyclodeaminase [Corynebacterium]MDK8240984.1 ornithine cyclodeaminase [Corynebacterium coyleae]MDK8662930.1 ornithine cyclodeaminase [Corynebacterium coyleae]MDK8706024.1 ornithine cyclodeaminase [Corynebacterium coyleae]MDK8732889.1 ornithine cyclodeaminase [Corynebacterium coyleae]MDK8892065.1 ornithine cyclodeaminase [Corynebacterium coyleae]